MVEQPDQPTNADSENEDSNYDQPQLKWDLIERLDQITNRQDAYASALESKALELLRYSGTILALIIAILAIVVNNVDNIGDDFNIYFIPGFILLLFIYILHVISVLAVIAPTEIGNVPKVESEDGFAKLLERYVWPDENEYLDQLITDYTGRRDEAGQQEDGLVQTNQHTLAEKNKHFENAVRRLALMVVGSVFVIFLALGTEDSDPLVFVAMLGVLAIVFGLLYSRGSLMMLRNLMGLGEQPR
jgi:hypothetical protein